MRACVYMFSSLFSTTQSEITQQLMYALQSIFQTFLVVICKIKRFWNSILFPIISETFNLTNYYKIFFKM